MPVLFRNDEALKVQVNDYLDLLVHGGVLFRSGLSLYLQDRPDEFHGRLNELSALAQQAGEMQRAMVGRIREPALIARSRDPLARCLERTDKIVRLMSTTLLEYAVEQPEPVLEGNALLVELAESSKLVVDAMASALRAHLTEASDETDRANAVRQAREETCALGERYKRMIFRLDLRLSHKNQLRHFADAMESIASAAAEAADRVIASRGSRSVSFGRWAFGWTSASWLALTILAVVVGTVVTLTAG